ncbi:MAG: hypothetical protein IJ875_07375, partial [Solobacterium sp.]|nr:hypothetical protein [Solobacterium sp.]
MKKLAFVIPWYGADIGGGAETELRGIVENLAKKEIPVEVLTTCVKQFQSDWGHNYHPEGEEMINGVLTRRFPVRKRNAYAFDKVNIHLMHGEMVSPMDQEIYMDEFVNSQALYNYIRDHQDEYAYFIYIPYMFPTTYYGILAAPEKSVMIPCFHEEAYIHMDIYKKAFEQSKGFLFLSKPEMELANEVFDIQDAKQLVLGAGVDTDANYDAESFRNKYQITEPFILYAGRKDEGKNIYLLLDYFAKWKHEYKKPLKLVLIGGGKVNIPHSVKDDVIDLGFLPLEDKSNAYAAATFL